MDDQRRLPFRQAAPGLKKDQQRLSCLHELLDTVVDYHPVPGVEDIVQLFLDGLQWGFPIATEAAGKLLTEKGEKEVGMAFPGLAFNTSDSPPASLP